MAGAGEPTLRFLVRKLDGGAVSLCGLDATIETVGNGLGSQGVEPFNIHREAFFHVPYKQTRLAIHTGR